jgi:hypothetical protein
MLPNSRSLSRKEWIATLASLAVLTPFSSAQNFTMGVTNPNPLGLGNFVPGFPGGPRLDELGMEGAVKGAFSFSIGASAQYDSNIYLTEDNEEDDVTFSLTPSFGYTSDPEGGADIVLTAGYSPSINAYLNNSDFSGINHSGSAALTIRGARTEVSIFGSASQYTGSDRLSGGFIDSGITTSAGIRASRQIAPRTSLNASFTASMSDYGDTVDSQPIAPVGPVDDQGSDVYTASVGGMWQSSERLSFGPSIRYTQDESDNTGTREAWALMFNANYKASEKIWLSASIGPETSENTDDPSGDSTFHIVGNLTATYIINERWTWMNSINSATVPSPYESGYNVFNVSYVTSLNRQLDIGSISGGLDFNVDQYEAVGIVTVDRDDEQSMGVFLSYGRPLFSDRIGFNSMLRYEFNNGETDWKQFTLSAGLNVSF